MSILQLAQPNCLWSGGSTVIVRMHLRYASFITKKKTKLKDIFIDTFADMY